MTPTHADKIMALADSYADAYGSWKETRTERREALRAALAEQPAPMSQPNRLVAYSAASKLRELGYEWADDAWKQPAEQEPVAYVCTSSHVTADGSMEDGPDYLEWADEASDYEKRVGTPLYTAPQPQPKQEPTREPLMVDMVPPATSRDRWMYEQGRLAERDSRTHTAPQHQNVSEWLKTVPHAALKDMEPLDLVRIVWDAAQPQREWVGLSEGEIRALVNLPGAGRPRTAIEMAYAVQAKLREKNGGTK